MSKVDFIVGAKKPNEGTQTAQSDSYVVDLPHPGLHDVSLTYCSEKPPHSYQGMTANIHIYIYKGTVARSLQGAPETTTPWIA